MPSAYWGVADAVGLGLPETWQAWLLLLAYLLLLLALLSRGRATLMGLTWRSGIGWLVLGIAGLLTSELLPLFFRLPGVAAGDEIMVALLATVPSLIAGIVLGPAPALLVGLSTGLGRALGRSHDLFDLFHFAFAAWLAASLVGVRYRGRLFDIVRLPPLAGLLSFAAVAVMAAFSTFVISSDLSFLGRFDAALLLLQSRLLPLSLEGLFGGFVVGAILLVKPEWRNNRDLVTSPFRRSVGSYLLSNSLFFALTMIVLVTAATFVTSAHILTRLVAAEMVAGALATSTRMTSLYSEMESVLVVQDIDTGAFNATKPDDRLLNRLFHQSEHYAQILLVDKSNRIASAYPPSAQADVLSSGEREAAGKARYQRTSSLVESTGQEARLSLVVPVFDAEQNSEAVLIGRIKEDTFSNMLAGLPMGERGVSAAVLSADGRLLEHMGSVQIYSLARALGPKAPAATLSSAVDPVSLVRMAEDGARHLVYVAPLDVAGLRLVVSLPFERVLSEALGSALLLASVLILLAGLFYVRQAHYGRDLGDTLSQLVRTSREVQETENAVPASAISREDELGDLSRALLAMRKSFKQRLAEQSLLLSVNREATTSIQLDVSIPVVLQGILRGTGAAGARALVLNPAGGQPLQFAEGPAAEELAIFDRSLLVTLREQKTVSLLSVEEMLTALQVDSLAVSHVQALMGFQLHSKGRFLGCLTVGFRQPGAVPSDDLALLNSLVEQASLLLERSYLFIHSESSRRRLAAILASTSEAVIVTDQTARVLVVNRAMERAFDIDAQKAINRLVGDVLDYQELAQALTSTDEKTRNLELVGKDGRTYFANTAVIEDADGRALGRVAVLHDITHLKELDQLKSEFVDNVSHDLRTPLTILSGYASALALFDDLTLEQRKYADNILNSVEQMIGLVDNLLDLGRIEAGFELSLQEVDVALLLQELVDEHWLFAHDSGIRLHVRVGEELPFVSCDEALIRQAVANLLTNGFKYAPNSGDMTVAAERRGDNCLISVRDRGPGIQKADQVRIFEKFYRVKRHGAGKAKGSGLGLAMVKRIAERHGGQAWCVSEPGKGSTFYISLPILPSKTSAN